MEEVLGFSMFIMVCVLSYLQYRIAILKDIVINDVKEKYPSIEDNRLKIYEVSKIVLGKMASHIISIRKYADLDIAINDKVLTVKRYISTRFKVGMLLFGTFIVYFMLKFLPVYDEIQDKGFPEWPNLHSE